jgi:hypothetical protein
MALNCSRFVDGTCDKDATVLMDPRTARRRRRLLRWPSRMLSKNLAAQLRTATSPIHHYEGSMSHAVEDASICWKGDCGSLCILNWRRQWGPGTEGWIEGVGGSVSVFGTVMKVMARIGAEGRLRKKVESHQRQQMPPHRGHLRGCEYCYRRINEPIAPSKIASSALRLCCSRHDPWQAML